MLPLSTHINAATLAKSDAKYFVTDKYCASGSKHISVDGTYELYDGNFADRSATTGPIFMNPCAPNCPYAIQVKLYAMQASNSYTYRIGSSSNTNIAVNRISYANPFQFDSNQFFTNWDYYDEYDGKWSDDANLRVVNCNSICVSGTAFSHLNGRYEWRSFDASLSGSVYFCAICDSGAGSYLKPRLYHNMHQWVIQSTSNDIDVHCNITNALNTSVAADVTACTAWASSNELHQPDIGIQRCDRAPSPTQVSNTHNPCLFGFQALDWVTVSFIVVICGIVCLCMFITKKRHRILEHQRRLLSAINKPRNEHDAHPGNPGRLRWSEGRQPQRQTIAEDEFIVNGEGEDMDTIGAMNARESVADVEGRVTMEGQ